MTRASLITRAALILLALSAPVFANAPFGGPDAQYANFDATDTSILDRWTGLRWDRASSAAAMTFGDAKVACKNGTRLPSLKELLTIVDETPHAERDEDDEERTRTIDRPAFGGTPPEDFWTSSVTGDTPARVWTVSFADGRTGVSSQTGTARVRCVRVDK